MEIRDTGFAPLADDENPVFAASLVVIVTALRSVPVIGAPVESVAEI